MWWRSGRRESGPRFLFNLQPFPKNLLHPSPKVKGLSLPWDLKVTPLSISTASMEVSKDTIGTGNDDFEVDMETNTKMTETVSTTGMETTESTMQESLDIKLAVTEKVSEGGSELTSKTFLEITEEFEVDLAEEGTTQESGMVFSSLVKVGAGVDAMGENDKHVEKGTHHQRDVNTEPPQPIRRRAIYEHLFHHHHQGEHHHQNNSPKYPHDHQL